MTQNLVALGLSRYVSDDVVSVWTSEMVDRLEMAMCRLVARCEADKRLAESK